MAGGGFLRATGSTSAVTAFRNRDIETRFREITGTRESIMTCPYDNGISVSVIHEAFQILKMTPLQLRVLAKTMGANLIIYSNHD